MTLYEIVKANIDLREVAQHYGITVNRHGKALCPFHDDHHPSLFVADDHFHCFGCGEHGDIIDFAAKLFGLSLYEAAVKLAADFHLDPDKPPTAAALQIQKPYTDAQKFRENERLCAFILSEYQKQLRLWKKVYAPQAPDTPIHPLFTEACHHLEYVEYLLDILRRGDPQERQTVVMDCLTDGKIYVLQDRLTKIRKEETHGQRKQYDTGLAA